MANPELAQLEHLTSRKLHVRGVEVMSGQTPLIDLTSEGFTEASEYLRYRQLVDRVTDAFGDAIVASRWLSTPSVDFNSQPPLEIAKRNGYDVSILEPVLIRIEHGVDF